MEDGTKSCILDPRRDWVGDGFVAKSYAETLPPPECAELTMVVVRERDSGVDVLVKELDLVQGPLASPRSHRSRCCCARCLGVGSVRYARVVAAHPLEMDDVKQVTRPELVEQHSQTDPGGDQEP